VTTENPTQPKASKDSFVHLHVHTEYSMLDGAARIGDLVEEVARQEMPAIAMTDHGNVFGAFDFYKQAVKVGVKPIIGIEAYVAPESRFDKKKVQWADGGDDDVSGGGAYTHMTILAENNHGLANLFKLSSLASLEGYYYKPRMDRELLSKYADGLIATTGCPGGEIQTRLRMGNYKEAMRAASDYRDIFGAHNFFLELMDHDIEVENRVKEDLINLLQMICTTPATKMLLRMRRCSASNRVQPWQIQRDLNLITMSSTSRRPLRCANSLKISLMHVTTHFLLQSAAM
jgi:DNA polymerase-3 subunit alpha